jgi:hypothetical protein
MTRIDFIRKIIRLGLLAVLSIMAFALGNKVVSANDCSGCPGKGICKGESDCENY